MNTKFCTINPNVIDLVQKSGRIGCLLAWDPLILPHLPGYYFVGFSHLSNGRSRFHWNLDDET